MLFLLSLAYLVHGVVGSGSDDTSDTAGWTYVSTDNTCLGTEASPCGPEYWGTNDASCALEAQSPIDISNTEIDLEMFPPEFHTVEGGCTEWSQSSSTSAFEIDMDTCDHLSLTYNGYDYDLEQMLFHSPSEHSIGGGYFAGEVHMVHNGHSHGYLVVGVMLELSTQQYTNNSFLDTLWSAGAGYTKLGELVNVTDTTTPLNPYASFLPASPLYYTYDGSFTTPPCTESVTWLVYDKPIKISEDDLLMIRTAQGADGHTIVSDEGNNNRPVQDNNHRTIQMYAGARGHAVAAAHVDNPNFDDVESYKEITVILGASSIGLSCLLLGLTICSCVKLRQSRGRPTPYSVDT